MKHIHLFILYKECCTTFNCFCWKHTKKSWKYCTFICIKIFWWQQYLDLFYTLNYFSRCCFIFILHVCYAFTLLAFYIYLHILKGKLKIICSAWFCFKNSILFLQKSFLQWYSLIYSFSCTAHNWFCITTLSHYLCHIWKNRLLPFTVGLQIYVIWLDYFVVCPWFL